jgi:hypothetical protein
VVGDDGDTLIDDVVAYFQVRGWPISQHESLPIVRMDFATDHAEGTMFVQVFPARRRVVTYAALPDRVPEARRVEVAELLTRANGALAIGNFELNFDDGEIRFRSGIDLGSTSLTDELIDPLVQSCLVSIGDHALAIQAVAAGRQTPQAAIEAVWQEAADIDLDLR